MSASLVSLCADAGIRLRTQPAAEANFAAVLPIIRVLLEMRRAGMFEALWVDQLKLRVQYRRSAERTNLSWATAERLTAEFLKRTTKRDGGGE